MYTTLLQENNSEELNFLHVKMLTEIVIQVRRMIEAHKFWTVVSFHEQAIIMNSLIGEAQPSHAAMYPVRPPTRKLDVQSSIARWIRCISFTLIDERRYIKATWALLSIPRRLNSLSSRLMDKSRFTTLGVFSPGVHCCPRASLSQWNEPHQESSYP